MALFGGGDKKVGRAGALKRVFQRQWSSAEELQEALRDLRAYKDLKAEELIPLLTHTDSQVRSFAETYLRERGEPRLYDALFEELKTKASRIQSLAFHAVVRTNPGMGVPHLAKLVNSPEKAVGTRAMEALSSLPIHEVGKEFVGFLAHERADVRYLALVKVHESQQMLKDPAIRSKVAAMVEDEDERVRLQMLDILADVDPSEAVRVALAQLKAPEPAIQQKAVRVLSKSLDQLGASSTTEDELLNLLTDGSEAVRSGVIEVIMKRPDRERILRKLLLFCKHLMGWMRDRTLVSLRAFANEITTPVIKLMNDEDEDVRSMALMLGSTLESKEAVPHIIKLLEDPDWWLRMIAAETLGKIGDPRAIGPLVKAMGHPDAAMACIEALARIGTTEALLPVAKAASAPQAEIRGDAVSALAKFKDPRVIPLLEDVRDQDPIDGIRERAKIAIDRLLGRLPEDEGSTASGSGSSGAMDQSSWTELDKLLVRTREMGGSDLHIVVDSPAVGRLHGELQELTESSYTPADTHNLIDSILTPRLRKLLDEEKQVDFCHTIEGIGRYRSNVYVERKGLSASFRTIPNEVPTLVDIGIPSHLADLVNYHQGLILVAGPSGSGKSTTLAALVNLFNERRRSHILLLEDPIEFVHPAKECLINQRQVNKHTESFASSLRGALRQDPDVIVVGEMRDPETVMLAIEASETGHLVIGTMNTTSAPKTIDRIIDNFPVAEQSQVRIMLSETVKAVVCQSLLPNAEGTGRVALFEVMVGTLGVRNLIRDNKTYQIIGQMQIGETQGHQTVDTALTKLLDARLITAEQAWLRAENKENFEHRVSPEFLAGQTSTV